MDDLEGRRPAGAAADLGAASLCRRIPSIPFPPLGEGEKVRGRRRPPAVSPWPGKAPPACLLGRCGIGWARVSPELLERRVDEEGGVEGGRRRGWERGGRRRGMSPGKMGSAAAAFTP